MPFIYLILSLLMLSFVQDTPALAEQKGATKMTYTFPAEETTHEGTWLTWPHAHTYGNTYRKEIEPIWVQMAQALATSERVHIIAYDEEHQKYIQQLLLEAGVDLNQVDFVLAPSDDVWSRDTGPMFVLDKNKQPYIVDFGFDGWGEKTPFSYDDDLPKAVAKARQFPILDVPDFILEGGSVELDGAGTALATKSAVISPNRNPNLSQKKAESYLHDYMGVNHVIWLNGVLNEDITDAHIDGFARFYNPTTILTVSKKDFLNLYEGIKASDYTILKEATNAKGEAYQLVTLPMTEKNVKGLDYKGSYLNFYVANTVLLLPIYQDANDQKAIDQIQELYPDKTIVPIDVTKLYGYGGMIHCVTQQQPLAP